MENKIEKNVLDFMNKCSEQIGIQEDGLANMQMWQRCISFIASPIEQLLFCALYTVIKLNGFCNPEPIDFENDIFTDGINVCPQAEIGIYRVDFLISFYHTYDKKQHTKEIIVECDSQQFHERTEQERRYEKFRDRYLQSKEFKVFRFTGSEIVKNPLKIAQEIISFISGVPLSDIQTDSNTED